MLYSNFSVGAALLTKEGRILQVVILKMLLMGRQIVQKEQPYLKQYQRGREIFWR